MPTSAPKISRPQLSQDQGFSLMEILVALLLAAIIFTSLPSSEDSRRHRDIQNALNDLDRAVRFASNEAVLRNTLVRLNVNLEKMPIEYSVEYGPRENMILPSMQDVSKLSLEEVEKEKKKASAIDSQFTLVEEFKDITREFSPEVEVLGVATSFQKTLIRDTKASIYFYPTGERDGALFFLGTQDELAYLEVLPFQEKTNAEYFPVASLQGGVAKAEDIRETKMEEITRNWFEK